MRRLRGLLLFLAGCSLLTGSASAQDRSLYWDSLTVDARLDAEGVLHVTERHAMVFDGPWNGGERSFQLRSWQQLSLESVIESHPYASEATPFVPGDLDQIGEYRLMDGNVLRWRNRMPDDPPFGSEPRTYEIRYSLWGVLVPEGEGYLLDHDLAFPQRDAAIRTFDATLVVDPAWQPAGALATRYHRENLAPGESVFASAQLRYVGDGRPSAVADVESMPSATAAPLLRYALLAIVIVFAILHARALIARERRKGRFEPSIPPDQIDEAWLRENVFVLAPEEVGAAWDLDTSASEVSALLARLALEGKIRSEVRTEGISFLKHEILHMELLCPRSELAQHERPLIDALFFDGGRTTSTDRIRQHYKKSGFNPSSLIEKPIQQRLPAIFSNRARMPASAKWLTFGLLVIGGLLSIFGGLPAPEETIPIALACAAALLVCYSISAIFAVLYRNAVLDLEKRLRRALVCISLSCVVAAVVLAGGWVPLLPLQYVGFAAIALGFLHAAFHVMRSKDSDEALQMRRKLAAARKYFERELAKETPGLQDDWFPYLLAFGLGPTMDRWFKAFGAEGPAHAARRSGAGASMPGSSRGSSGGRWTGGGGTFGGAGASGSWASAVGGIASGVAAASSSSGGSRGGGGGRSSGGGGGGGW